MVEVRSFSRTLVMAPCAFPSPSWWSIILCEVWKQSTFVQNSVAKIEEEELEGEVLALEVVLNRPY